MSSRPIKLPRVLHVPAWTGNPYLDLLTRSVEKHGWATEIVDFRDDNATLFELTQRGMQQNVIHLHWPDPYFAKFFWNSSALAKKVKPLLIPLDTLRTKLGGARIVWTVHNETAHETSDQRLERRLARQLAASVDHLIFHSENAKVRFSELHGQKILDKSSVIAHGNYDGVYPGKPIAESRYRATLVSDPETTTFLMFGAIREYKGITNVVQSFLKNTNPKTRLLIAGKPYSKSLTAKLNESMVGEPRIKMIAEHIPDDEVATILGAVDAVVFGFERTFSSGSLALALTMGKPIIATRSAAILGLIDDRSSKFYNDETDLVSIFENSRRAELVALAKQSRLIADTLSWEGLGRQIVDVYENVVRS